MPSNSVQEAAVDPVVAVDELISWLLSAAVHCALGVAIGVLIARTMRSRHLHWSWAAGAGAIVVLARPVLAGWTATLAIAALLASIRGRRWHREDLDAGVDLAEIAAARTSAVDLIGSLARPVALHVCARMRTATHRRARELQLGVDERGRAARVPFALAGGSHTLVVGATGSGKTVTQAWIAAAAIERGMGAVVLDPKGDRDLREQLRRGALAAGRAFLEWTPEGDRVYNPYARGGVSEIADKALAGERFTEPHYLRQAQRYLAHAVRALRQSGAEVSLRAIVEQLEPARLEQLARGLPDAGARATFAYLDGLSSRQQSELAGVRDRLAILAESDVGPWLDPQTDAERFDLLAAVRSRAVVYFSLQSDSRPLLSEMLGAAIVQDLQTTVACLQASPVPTLVAIDEFSAIAATQVVGLFARARSAGFRLLLGTQELSDLRPPGRERLLEQVLGNLSVLIAHRQVVPDSAELIASLAGSRGAWRVTRHSDGRSTRTRGHEPVLEAERVMRLGRGWAAVLVLDQQPSARLTRICSPGRPW
ncbi:MAG TPA: type IV secretion system DNA-binding domain-containing protein [Solirubrobacteraceae bacterium]|nr:type IV secretion system DNA-binding domain-containing protein [Solirubrobacteraceae bacterium]